MPTITRDQVKVPADVMPEARETYIDNYMKATRGTGRLMLFACDQKIEHLNKDFYGEGIDILRRRSPSIFSRSVLREPSAFWLVSVVSLLSTLPTIRRSTTSSR